MHHFWRVIQQKCVEMQEAPHIIDGLYSLAQMHETMEDYEAAISDNQRIIEYLASDFGIVDGEQVDSRKREMEHLKSFLIREKKMSLSDGAGQRTCSFLYVLQWVEKKYIDKNISLEIQ